MEAPRIASKIFHFVAVEFAVGPTMKIYPFFHYYFSGRWKPSYDNSILWFTSPTTPPGMVPSRFKNVAKEGHYDPDG